MTRTRLELLQWFGLLAGGAAWAVHLVFGYGMTLVDCSAGSRAWGVSRGVYELPLTVGALAVAVLAETAAAVVYRQVRQVHYDAPGPRGRLHFFAVAALVGNVLFATAIVLEGIGVFAGAACRQS
jgi:hypothetical protein